MMTWHQVALPVAWSVTASLLVSQAAWFLPEIFSYVCVFDLRMSSAWEGLPTRTGQYNPTIRKPAGVSRKLVPL